MNGQPLTLADIADQRAYERERDEFRRSVIANKKLRRVTVGLTHQSHHGVLGGGR